MKTADTRYLPRKLAALLLALVMTAGLMPTQARAAEADPPDWYFLFAIFKNVDADVKDKDGKVTHQTYTMPQEEIDLLRDIARDFEEYMTSTGVMRAHVDVVEFDTPVTELALPDNYSSRFRAEQAAPLLKTKVNLDQYDHVTCILNLNVGTGWGGVTLDPFENGTGLSNINYTNWEVFQDYYIPSERDWFPQVYSHEFLHFMEFMSRKWGVNFDEHLILNKFYPKGDDNRKSGHTDMYLNRVKGDAETGTGVAPAVWQYPPHVLRTMTELTVPSSVTSIGKFAFASNKILTRVFIPSSVTSIGGAAFQACSNLTSVSLPASITRVEDYTFANAGLKDVYYSGSEAQWKAIPIGVSNGSLRNATVHYNHLLADVKTTDYFAQPVAWALENGITAGTGAGRFSPGRKCTQAQILTFLWRAAGSPKASRASSISGVSPDAYYYDAIQWAAEKELFVGGSFDPGAECTRGQAVTFMWKYAGEPSSAAALPFTDVDASRAPAVQWALENQVTGGTTETTFSPDSPCTRGQIVTFLHRAFAK